MILYPPHFSENFFVGIFCRSVRFSAATGVLRKSVIIIVLSPRKSNQFIYFPTVLFYHFSIDNLPHFLYNCIMEKEIFLLDRPEYVKFFTAREDENFCLSAVGYHNFHYVSPYSYFRKQKYYTLHFVLSGHGYLTVNGGKYYVRPHEFFLLDDESVFAYYPEKDDPWEYVWFEFHGSTIEKCAKESGFSESRPVRACSRPQKIYAELKQFFEKAERPCSVSYLEALSLFFLSLSSAAEERQDVPFFYEKDYVEEVKRFIEVKYMNEDFSVEYLCKYMHISHSHLCRIFKRSEGVSVVSYVKSLRLSRAEELLKTTDLQIGEIARMCGYRETEYFFRQFKTAHSLTPAEYRRRL